ncbi:bacterio-opsin activator [Halorubrum sp. CBA1125]|uniref:helix-turn-helix domain-containing protein n=1 Tax=Halorubrum sp. CBA1125 TaxID=2668072 RepID=UPI0012E8DF6E|nr:helix-turn-helix domain-containing protein [Halorubrum sp. CBA1125]MUW14187.1 bacterio-opsin activator [Halorubrum sp. CBA1125]
MTILVEFGISNERFALGEHIGRHAALSAELERVVPTGDNAIPYVWVTGAPETLAELVDTLESSDAVGSVSVRDQLSISDTSDEEHLFRIVWDLEELDVVRGIIESGGTILEGECVDHSWVLRLRFSAHEDVAAFYQYLTDHGITEFTIDSIYELQTRSGRGGSNDLTREQREALALAANRGYFESPREVTLEEIGADLGITQQAVSDRIRRGVRQVVHSTLNIPERPPE